MKPARPYLKKLIADIVASKLHNANWSRLEVAADVRLIKVTHCEGDLYTLIQIETPEGSRWYEVTVKEKYT